jgi:hypothetical protein
MFGSSGIVSFVPLWEEPVGVPFLRYITPCAALMYVSLGTVRLRGATGPGRAVRQAASQVVSRLIHILT